MYRIAIVEDMPRSLRALVSELNDTGEVTIVFVASNGDDFLRKMKECARNDRPQIVLMDVDMPVLNGIETVKIASQLYSSTSYIMLTVSDDDDKLFEAIRAGAHGYLLKEERPRAIVNAIKDVIERQGAPMSPRIARKTLQLLAEAVTESDKKQAELNILSAREMTILSEMADGLDYREISEKLSISPNTVRNHISNIYDKLHVSSKAQAVRIALRNKWI